MHNNCVSEQLLCLQKEERSPWGLAFALELRQKLDETGLLWKLLLRPRFLVQPEDTLSECLESQRMIEE